MDIDYFKMPFLSWQQLLHYWTETLSFFFTRTIKVRYATVCSLFKKRLWDSWKKYLWKYLHAGWRLNYLHTTTKTHRPNIRRSAIMLWMGVVRVLLLCHNAVWIPFHTAKSKHYLGKMALLLFFFYIFPSYLLYTSLFPQHSAATLSVYYYTMPVILYLSQSPFPFVPCGCHFVSQLSFCHIDSVPLSLPLSISPLSTTLKD